jgi:SNF2 family DNA or RNA helicase
MDHLIEPWAHQRAAEERAAALDYYALFFEQGTGKTSTMINILRRKFELENGNSETPFKTLILCPPIVIDNWKRELLRYSRLKSYEIHTLTGSWFQRLSATDSRHNGIYITNYQALLMEKLYQRFLEFGFRAVILDESHKIKTYNSKTTKRVQELGKLAQYRYCLTGTPVLNTAADMFPQITFLDRGQRFGKSFTAFRQEYFHDFNQHMPRHCYFPNWKMKPDTTARINKIIEPISSRVLKKDCLDLPPLVRQRIDCPMTDEQSRVYRDLEKDFVASLSPGTQITADLEITKGLRLQQIVSGYVPDEKEGIHGFRPNSRIEATRELLEGVGPHHKVIIWGCFRENFRQLELLCSEMGIHSVSVFGGLGSEEATKRCHRFETDDRTRVLIGHPKSCGIGVNLTAASYSIFFSRSFDRGDDEQAEARNYRGGSERHGSITRIDLVTPGTIDEVILEALANKQSLSEAILKHYKKG